MAATKKNKKAAPKKAAQKTADESAPKKSGRGGARPGAGRPRQGRLCGEYEKIGPPPDDALSRINWAHDVNSLAMWHTMSDERLTEVARRKELREISRVLAALIPAERLRRAEQLIVGDAEKVEKQKEPEMHKRGKAKRPKAVRATTRRVGR